ncbi:MAG: type I-C CRISPR-associated protein Cas8c/Csd1 [Eubacteriales bacterium]
MSWLLNLYETYESNLDLVGIVEKKYNDEEYTLLPISHTTQTAHIEVDITEDGEFHSARVVEKKEGITLIPTTEDSSNRAGAKVAPYPLHDKLIYVAGDFIAYGGKIKNENDNPFDSYIKQLENWCQSPYANSKVKSIYHYLSKRQLIEDLVQEKILYIDDKGLLIQKWDDKKYKSMIEKKPEIFTVLSGEIVGAFIRFNVYSPSKVLEKVWKDTDMYQSFILYYKDKLNQDDLCYVTGKSLPSSDKHANKIRNSGDKAKLISANDSSGFTFRGRFDKSNEVASISYDVSQKAHNALKWLIQKQGKIVDQRVFLVWCNDEISIIDPNEDTSFILPGVAISTERISYTNQELAREVSKALGGYKNNLSSKSDVNIIILDAATTGRLAVLYYRNMEKNLYLDRLAKWHSTCTWLHMYRKDKENKNIKFYGAPATKDIAYAAYGTKANEKVIKELMERLLPCIIDDRNIPLDIVKSAFYRASNPGSMEKWEWEKTLSITCALINKKEELNMALDKENNDRDYLFGRLLAIADVLERRALGSDDPRSSNAIRYMNSFSQHPERTWKTIQASLQPYQAKLGAKGLYLSMIIDEVASRINYDDFNNRPLSGKYLLGFYSQRHELYQGKEKNSSQDNNKEGNE